MRQICIILRFLLLLTLANLYRYSGRMHSQSSETLKYRPEIYDFEPIACFRVTFGLKDSEPKTWNGQVLAKTGQTLRLEADQFRATDYAELGFGPSGREVQVRSRPENLLVNDYLRDETSWVCSTREASMHGLTTEYHVSDEKPKPIILHPSILIHLLSNTLEEPIRVKTVSGEFSFMPRELIRLRASYFLEGSVRVESLARLSRIASEGLAEQDFPSVLTSRSGELWVAWQEYDDESDSVLVRSRSGNDWKPVRVLVQKSDVFRTALGEDARGRTWVIWSMQVDGNWDLYGCFVEGGVWSKLERLTAHPGPDIYHNTVTDSMGRLWLVWQRTGDRFSQIFAKYFDGKQWSKEEQISEGVTAQGNNWWPVVAAGADGSLAIAWDGYASGSYDIYLRRREKDIWGEVETVVGTARFEAHPTIAIDDKNRIWVAWDESGVDWGKDTGFLVIRKGTQLHESRRIRVACLDGNRWLTTQADVSEVLKEGEFWELPRLQIDQQGRPWLLVRHLVMRQPDTPFKAPIELALWEIQVTAYDGSHWTELISLPRSTGRNDMMSATTLTPDGNVWVAWASDLRSTKSFLPQRLEVQLGRFADIHPKKPLDLKNLTRDTAPFVPFHPHEAEQVKRIRTYRIHTAGKSYSIYRGDLHRHTDISLDGNNDGSLLDAYRYSRDAAALDFLGIADHNDVVEDPYAWWLSQKFADLFQVSDSFVAFYGYERSVEYPNGQRNIFFTKRGAKITPISEAEKLGWEGTERLYWYLRRAEGFSIPHTTGRTSGTDWRDNDPKVETLLEIFQGMRDTYEYPGSPRPKRLWQPFLDPSLPIPRASSSELSPSFRPSGFAWKALEKGYKLGFVASSDHISTHISYACLIAERLTPESLLEAIRARRAYAATDNIILDVRYRGSDGEHLMGDKFVSSSPVRVEATILGTGEIQQIDLIKNGSFLHTLRPNQLQYNFEFVDNKVTPGESYYYVRIIQKDGEMAWGSPVWVTCRQ